MYEALLYTDDGEKGRLRCGLCRHRCILSEGASGRCGVRKNIDGKLYSIFYGRPIAIALDPIEKKPLYHFMPGSSTLSIACPGCNFECAFCQNSDISQYGRVKSVREPAMEISPEEICAEAEAQGAKSISYTYTEPTVFFEYALDIARIAAQRGLANIFVTNGFMTREAIDLIAPFLNAANVDLKSFSVKSYRDIMKGDLDGVCNSIRYMHELGIWIEITTLIVPGMNDDMGELRELAEFIVSVDPGIPWHISRFIPRYQMMDRVATPIATLEEACEIGKSTGLKYVHIGNV